MTNAVLHARTELEVGLTVSTRCILVTVYDIDLTRPTQQPYTASEGGWGLGLVSALAQDSAMDLHPDGGKTAWFRLGRDEPVAGWDSGAAQRSGTGPVTGGFA